MKKKPTIRNKGISFDNTTDIKGKAFVLKLREDDNLVESIRVPFEPKHSYKARIQAAQTEMNRLAREKIAKK